MKEFQLKVTNEHLFNAVMAHSKDIGYNIISRYDEEKPYIQFWQDVGITYHHCFYGNNNRFPLISLEDFFAMKSEIEINISLFITRGDFKQIQKDLEILSVSTDYSFYEQVLKALKEYN